MSNEKLIRNWPHMKFAVLEVPGAKAAKGAIKLSSPLWAHFVDLYLGAGIYRLQEGSTDEERRIKALRALESCWPDFRTGLHYSYRIYGIEWQAFVVKHEPTIRVAAPVSASSNV